MLHLEELIIPRILDLFTYTAPLFVCFLPVSGAEVRDRQVLQC